MRDHSLFLKNPELEPELGESELSQHAAAMLEVLSDRGPDSTGFAIYGEGAPDGSVANILGVRLQSSHWGGLPRQRIELLRRMQFACRLHLILPDHVLEFDTDERSRS